jgi:hypothetical protein
VVQAGSGTARRRPRSAVPRGRSVTAWYSDEEFEAVVTYAAAARLATAAFVAEASLRPSAWKVGLAPSVPDAGADAAQDGASGGPVGVSAGPVLEDAPGVGEQRRMLLLELMGVHRQLRGACTNLNQAVAKLNALGEPVGELSAIAEYVRRVATAADEAVAAVRIRR